MESLICLLCLPCPQTWLGNPLQMSISIGKFPGFKWMIFQPPLIIGKCRHPRFSNMRIENWLFFWKKLAVQRASKSLSLERLRCNVVTFELEKTSTIPGVFCDLSTLFPDLWFSSGSPFESFTVCHGFFGDPRQPRQIHRTVSLQGASSGMFGRPPDESPAKFWMVFSDSSLIISGWWWPEHDWMIFPYIVHNNPNWRTHTFQRGRHTTKQISIWSFLEIVSHVQTYSGSEFGSRGLSGKSWCYHDQIHRTQQFIAKL